LLKKVEVVELLTVLLYSLISHLTFSSLCFRTHLKTVTPKIRQKPVVSLLVYKPTDIDNFIKDCGFSRLLNSPELILGCSYLSFKTK
jgi:hypothetical protein